MAKTPMQHFEQMPTRQKTVTLASIQTLAATAISILTVFTMFGALMPDYATESTLTETASKMNSRLNNIYMELMLNNLQTSLRVIESHPKEEWSQRTTTEYEAMVSQVRDLKRERNKLIGAVGLPE